MLHLRVFEVRYLDMVRRCIADGTGFGVVALLSGNEVRSPEGLETLAPVGTMARIESWDAPMPALLALRCVGAGRFRLHASQLAKYGLWMGEAEAIADDPPAEVPADLQDCADALGRLIAGWQREGVPAHAAGAAVPAGRLRLGGRPLVRAAAATGGRAGPAAGAARPVARLAAVRQALRDAS